jgi:7-cyano-7-deazaguanine synthase
LQDGEALCKELGLDFNEVYSRTNTSYKPIYIVSSSGDHWYSDYKSASSVERVEAFIKLGRKDPAGYADETGVVTWNHVVNEVSKILKNHNTEYPTIEVNVGIGNNMFFPQYETITILPEE